MKIKKSDIAVLLGSILLVVSCYFYIGNPNHRSLAFGILFVSFMFFINYIRNLILNNEIKIWKRVLSLFKLLLPFFLFLYLAKNRSDINFLIIGLLEISVIIWLSDIFVRPKFLSFIINDLLFFLMNANLFILIFGSNYLNRTMLTNIESIQDLTGNAFTYFSAVILTIVFSFIPFNKTVSLLKKKLLLIIVIPIYVVGIVYYGISYSPLANYTVLAKDEIHYWKLLNNMMKMKKDKKEFYSNEVIDYVKKDKKISDNPNIILIFAEGVSQSIIDDERNIMPNIREYENKSISFDNYYNHTFATYRGIIGQLYSGYQFDNKDTNTFISLADVFNDNDYQTLFINSEPYNKLFKNYLSSFGFDNVLSDTSKVDGVVSSVSDKTIFSMICDNANKLYDSDKPFFISTYTLGTHLSLKSSHEVFGDGSNNLLNRFYNLDYQFGEFMKQVEESEFFDNTIIIFTTDHATYMDSDFSNTFNGYYNRVHAGVDEIPFFIYYKGVKTKNIDADGRNSIDLAPTILDFLDISHENYFLGVSLFAPNDKATYYDYIFYDGEHFAKTEHSMIDGLNTKKDKEYINNIYSYVANANKSK